MPNLLTSLLGSRESKPKGPGLMTSSGTPYRKKRPSVASPYAQNSYLNNPNFKFPTSGLISTNKRTGAVTMHDVPGGKLKFKNKVDQLSFIVDHNKSLRNDKSFSEEERAQEILRRKKLGFRNAYKSGHRFNEEEIQQIRDITGEDSLAFLRQ